MRSETTESFEWVFKEFIKEEAENSKVQLLKAIGMKKWKDGSSIDEVTYTRHKRIGNLCVSTSHIVSIIFLSHLVRPKMIVYTK